MKKERLSKSRILHQAEYFRDNKGCNSTENIQMGTGQL